MKLKFYCEAEDNIPLTPDFKFPKALNYLNPENNSFYILEKGKDYMQCGGSKLKCTIELRQYDKEGNFKHYIFYNPNGTNEDVHVHMSDGGVFRKKKHCFGFLTASKLLSSFSENKNFPDEICLEDISSDFI